MSGSVKYDDDVLEPVANVSSVSTRIGTPSKADSRSGTPHRSGSANRAGSAGRGMTFAKSTATVDSCKRVLRCTSTRKERRWENENFLGAPGFMQISSAKEYEEMMKHGNNILHGAPDENFFKDILKSKNSDLLNIFMSCQERLFLNAESRPANTGGARKKIKTETEYQRAERLWNKIDKRLKEVATKTLNRSEILCTYVTGLEAVLLVYAQLGYAPSVPEELKDTISVRLKPMKQSSVGLTVTFLEGVENVTLHRLLLHAVCQFHGFKSQSVGAGDSRVTLVHNSEPVPIETRVSEDGVVTAVMTQPSAAADVEDLKVADIKLSMEDDYVVVDNADGSQRVSSSAVPSREGSGEKAITAGVSKLSLESSGRTLPSAHSSLVNMALLTFLRLSGKIESAKPQ